jgi:hypothetical protein
VGERADRVAQDRERGAAAAERGRDREREKTMAGERLVGLGHERALGVVSGGVLGQDRTDLVGRATQSVSLLLMV